MNRSIVVALLVLASCGPQEAEVQGTEETFETDSAPLLGAASGDQADRGCNVVLRSGVRDGLSCSSTGCWFVFTGVIDISEQAVAEGARPYVLVKNIDATTWTKVSTTKSSGAPGGFARYTFRATRNTLTDGMSATAYQRAYVEVAPYLLTKTGARLFDHNRNPDGFTNYKFQLQHNWAIGEDAQVCGARPAQAPHLGFTAGWQTTQRGALVAGQPFVLDYAIERLDTCRGTHNGYPAWDLQAFVRFAPSGQIFQGSVRGFNSPSGVPSNAGAVSAPLTVEIPAGTTGVELWFQNFTGAGSSCVAWDSAQGSNYGFGVESALPAAVMWEGNAGSSFSRACWREDGVPANVNFDSYLQQRACSFVDVDVYVPGLTDGASQKPAQILAEAQLTLDGKVQPAASMTFVGRFGNDYRYQFEVPRSDLFYGAKWTSLTYAPRFSTDGRTWLKEPPRTITRDVSFCNPAWTSCAL